MKIPIRSIIGSDSAVTFDLGVKVREFYGDHWQHELIDLDFEGIRSVSPSFLSQAIAPIIREYPNIELSAHVRFSDVPSSFELSWQKVQQAVSRRSANGVDKP